MIEEKDVKDIAEIEAFIKKHGYKLNFVTCNKRRSSSNSTAITVTIEFERLIHFDLKPGTEAALL